MRRRLISSLKFLGIAGGLFAIWLGFTKFLMGMDDNSHFLPGADIKIALLMGLVFGGMIWAMITRPLPEDLDTPATVLGRHLRQWNALYFWLSTATFLWLFMNLKPNPDNIIACVVLSTFATGGWCAFGYLRNGNAKDVKDSDARQVAAKALHDAIVTWGRKKLGALPDADHGFVIGMLNRPMHILHMIDKNGGWWNRNFREYANGAMNTQLEFMTIITQLGYEVDPLYRQITDAVMAVSLKDEPETDKVSDVIEKLKS